MNKIDIGKGKITSHTCRGLVCDAKAAVMLWVGFFSFSFHCTTNKVPHLILRDETIGFHWLLPLEEDHVIQRGEGQGLWSDATRNYKRREKQPFLKQTLHSGLKLMDSCAGMPGGKNTLDKARRHREGWRRMEKKGTER